MKGASMWMSKKRGRKGWTASMDVQSTNCRIMDGKLHLPLKHRLQGRYVNLRTGSACRMWNPKWESGPFPEQKKKAGRRVRVHPFRQDFAKFRNERKMPC